MVAVALWQSLAFFRPSPSGLLGCQSHADSILEPLVSQTNQTTTNLGLGVISGIVSNYEPLCAGKAPGSTGKGVISWLAHLTSGCVQNAQLAIFPEPWYSFSSSFRNFRDKRGINIPSMDSFLSWQLRENRLFLLVSSLKLPHHC